MLAGRWKDGGWGTGRRQLKFTAVRGGGYQGRAGGGGGAPGPMGMLALRPSQGLGAARPAVCSSGCLRTRFLGLA